LWSWRTARGKGRATAPEGRKNGPPAIGDDELLDRIAEEVTKRRLGVPAILFLESSKPLSYVGSQLLFFLEPFVRTFVTTDLYERFATLIEDRANYELLIKKIEQHEARAADARAAAKAASRKKGEDK
jgi:hypothetical protein